jgi:fatty acid amide hydrolase 2
LTASVNELSRRIRRREISPIELCEAHIRRIREVNGELNALVGERFASAIEEARDAEDVVAAAASPDDLPPLIGIPCTIKEFIAVTGMPQTGGLLSRRLRIAEEDATVVDRLRNAGAIVLGVTNVPEGGMWIETANKVYGRTNNPWDLSRTPGGSSGGEAALLAVGGSPFGIGSDIAGSIRLPAAFCGVVGHKPTARSVPNTGHWGSPVSATPAAADEPAQLDSSVFLTCGPMCRYVEDLPLLLSIIAGPDGRDKFVVERRELDWDAEVDLSELELYPLVQVGSQRASAPAREAVSAAVDALSRRGARVRELDARLFEPAFATWALTMSAAASADGASFHDALGDGSEINVWAEIGRSLVGRARYTVPALGLVLLEQITDFIPRRLTANVPCVQELRAQLDPLLGERGVLIVPPYPRSAPRHGAALLRPFDFIFTGIFSVLEYPATQVPVGFDRRGLPLGVQVVAARGNDHLTIAAAGAIEKTHGGWRKAECAARRRA